MEESEQDSRVCSLDLCQQGLELNLRLHVQDADYNGTIDISTIALGLSSDQALIVFPNDHFTV